MNNIEQLLRFKSRDKFSITSWNERGLVPSDKKKCKILSVRFNEITDGLLNAIRSEQDNHSIKELLLSSLHSFSRNDYDTEEREFICDLFIELAQILEMDIKPELHFWLYPTNLLRSERLPLLKVIQQNCPKCGLSHEIHVYRIETDVPDRGWLIIECNNCAHFSLFDAGPCLKIIQEVNFKRRSQLKKTEYSLEDALAKIAELNKNG